MKKLALALVALFAVTYPVASWMTGRQVEAAFDEAYAQLAESPYLKVTDRRYERGVFSSNAESTLRLSLGEMARAQGGAARTDLPSLPTIEILSHTSFRHGPLPGLGGLAAASWFGTFTVTKVDDESVDLSNVFAGQPPLTIDGSFGFDGSLDARLTVPAFETKVDLGGAAGVIRVAWGGLRADTHAADLAGTAYRQRTEVPKVEIWNDNGMHLTIAGGRMSSDMRRIHTAAPATFGGNGEVSFESIAFSKGDAADDQMRISNLEYAFTAPETLETADFSSKVGASSLQIGATTYGPAHCDVTLERIERKIFADLLTTFQRANGTQLPPDARQEAVEAIDKILASNPALRIDRLSLIEDGKEAKATARIALNDAKIADLATPQQVLSKIDATLDLEIPHEALALLPAQTRSQAQMVILAFKAQGYVGDQGGVIKSSIVARNGGVTMNGKALDLSALIAPRSASL